MRRILVTLAIAAGPALCPAPATAEPTASGPSIVVEGGRTICRRAVRTSSRMRTGRVCRTQAEWRANGVAMASRQDNIEDAQNALDMFGERVSTNCIGGELTRENGRTALGPR